MTDIKIKLPTVGANEIETAMAAAMSRINDVPASETLISSIPDAEWLADDVKTWQIEAGSCLENQDELDCVDGSLDNNKVA